MIGVVTSSLAMVPRIRAADLTDSIFHIGRYSGDIVSDYVFPLHVYVLSLPDVGNYRLTNHSAIVEGAIEATQPIGQDYAPPDYRNQTDYFFVQMGSFYSEAELKVNISCSVISDWSSYRDLVDSGSNVIIVNTHDEYLPVPAGYSREAWTDRIADFMLNRWGTWVHVAGYPFYRVRYENGTTEQWGDKGFQQLMGHIGRANIVCGPPPGVDPAGGGYSYPWASFYGAYELSRNWALSDHGFALGFALRNDSRTSITPFDGLFPSYVNDTVYYPGAIVRFGPTTNSSGFGSYVHLGSWQFEGTDGEGVSDEHFNGLLATAAAIYDEFDALRFLGAVDTERSARGSAFTAIQGAIGEGRTLHFEAAVQIYHLGVAAYADGEYKLSKSCAQAATLIANGAVSPLSEIALIIGFIIAVPLSLTILLFYRLSVLRGQEGLVFRLGPRIKWWLQFLAFSEPERHHGIIDLHRVGTVGFSLLTAAIWALGPLIVLAGIVISSLISPSLIVVGTLLSIGVGVFSWLEFLHILYDRPPKKEVLPPPMTARYNTSLKLYICPKCRFPLDANGGTCKVCGANIEPAENQTGF